MKRTILAEVHYDKHGRLCAWPRGHADAAAPFRPNAVSDAEVGRTLLVALDHDSSGDVAEPWREDGYARVVDAAEQALHWLEEEKRNPGQATPREIIRVLMEALKGVRR